MKKLVLSFVIVAMAVAAQAQDCSELFISEYVHGANNNRAIEIYNPTASPINLNAYSLGRFSNGSATLTGTTIIPMPSRTIAAYSTFVICCDKGGTNPTDTAKGVTGTTSEHPLWNGYQKVGISADPLTGIPYLGANNDTLHYALSYAAGATADKNRYQWESTYKPQYDLRGHCDLFVSPVYNTNNVLYHSGNDAMALLKGTTLTSPVVDAVGIIGDLTMQTGTYWGDPSATGYRAILTKQRTLQRKATVKTGRVLESAAGDTQFNVADWDLYSANYFMGLGQHTCNCFVSTDNTTKKAVFSYFPNPINQGFITLRASEGIRSASLLNALGQVVRSEKMSGDVSEQINLGGLTGGIYMLTVQFVGGAEATQKVVVQ